MAGEPTRKAWVTARPLRAARDVLLDLLFPARCVHCSVDLPDEERTVPLCVACWRSFAVSYGAACLRCGTTLPAGFTPRRRCRRCKQRRLAFSSVIHLGRYQEQLRLAVLHTKSSHHEALAATLAELLWERRSETLRELRPRCVVPVPMFWGRRFFRWTNSSEVIAERLAARLGAPFRNGLSRRRNTLPQAGLAALARQDNVRGAFRLRRGFHCRGAHVLLVDDILTTGATCNEAAKVLLRGGADKVAVAVLARAEGPD